MLAQSPIGTAEVPDDEAEEDEEECEGQPLAAGCWRRFRQWVHCFCVVTFDLELGQTIEVVYPGDAALSSQERSDLCYAAFPDSNSTMPSPAAHGSTPMMLRKGDQQSPEGPSDSTHHFRIRRAPLDEQNVVDTFSYVLEELLPASLRPDRRFLHGFSYFRRQRDALLPRGYFQKSIVLVSALPFVALFQRILPEVALAFFTGGESAIETACLQMDRHWPSPTCVGRPLSLPLFGLHFQCVIPTAANAADAIMPEVEHLDLATNNASSKLGKFLLGVGGDAIKLSRQNDAAAEDFEFVEPINNNCSDCGIVQLNSVHEIDQHFYDGMRRLLPHLQLIWELVLLGEPVLVLAPTASLSSALVHALIGLIGPLRYYGDYRPFFTIHDSDFVELSARQNCCVNNFVLGVTNPFFLKAFAHWPHILKMGPDLNDHNNNNINSLRRQRSSDSRLLPMLLRSAQQTTPAGPIAQRRTVLAAAAATAGGGGGGVTAICRSSGTTATSMDSGGGKERTEQNGANGHSSRQQEQEVGHIQHRTTTTTTTIRRLSDRAQLDHRSAGGLLSAHRQFLYQDKSLSRKLLRTHNDSASQWYILRRHFVELTQSFINPLERYIASLLPLRRHLCPFQPVPSTRPFSLDHFLSSLQHFGHPGVRGDWQGLYRQFVARSPNFIGWLQQRRRDIEWQLREEHLEVLCTANLSPDVLCRRNQVEIVDLVLKFRDRLAELEGRKKQQQPQQCRRRGLSASPMKKQSVVDRQRVQLQQQLNCLLSSVDDELKNLLMSNNALRRAAANAK
uniref:UDENN domain-containing protein n=1 Tax=Globodera pallida TaxID=36090 RepID=A0A183CE13_GLOPA